MSATIRQQIGQHVDEVVHATTDAPWASFALLPSLPGASHGDASQGDSLALLARGTGGFGEFRDTLGADAVLGVARFTGQTLLVSYQPDGTAQYADVKGIARAVQQAFGKGIALAVHSVGTLSLSDAMITARLRHSGLVPAASGAATAASVAPGSPKPAPMSATPQLQQLRSSHASVSASDVESANESASQTGALQTQQSAPQLARLARNGSGASRSDSVSRGRRTVGSASQGGDDDGGGELEVIAASMQQHHRSQLAARHAHGAQLEEAARRAAAQLGERQRERAAREEQATRAARATVQPTAQFWVSHMVAGTWRQRWATISGGELRLKSDNQAGSPTTLAVALHKRGPGASPVRVVDVSGAFAMPNTFELQLPGGASHWFSVQTSEGRPFFLHVVAALERAAGSDSSLLVRGRSVDCVAQPNLEPARVRV